ncbi:MAG: DUF2892 domain-containing protein [Desulfobacterales bacterium]
MLSAIAGWCPISALLGISTCKQPFDVRRNQPGNPSKGHRSHSRVSCWQCYCIFLHNNLFTCIIHHYSDRVRSTKCNAIGPLERVAQGRDNAELTR